MEREGAPAPDVPESRRERERRIHFIDGQLQGAFESILASSCEIGLTQDRGVLLYILDGKRFEAPNRLIRTLPLPLPFPLNKPEGHLSVECPGGRTEIVAGWREGMLNVRIEISGKVIGDGPRLSSSRMPEYYKYYFPHQEYVGGMRKFEYERGNIDLTEFEPVEAQFYVPDGFGFILTKPMVPEQKPIASSDPSPEQFVATQEWQEVLRMERSLRQVADKLREQSAKGHTPRLHIPHPSGRHNTHN